MKQNTFTCDRCKKSETVDSPRDSKLKLLCVGVAVEDSAQVNTYYGSTVPMTWMRTKQDWCEQCRIEVGLVFQTAAQMETNPPPTLEEQLIETLKVFVQENQHRE